jgi:hypothetical protein
LVIDGAYRVDVPTPGHPLHADHFADILM